MQTGTNSSLVVSNLNPSNVGQYVVVVDNPYASATSHIATLAFPPSVTAQPSNQIVFPGDSICFEVSAGGIGPFLYQWQFNGTNLPNNIITTVAGGGSGGDGSPATRAGLNAPRGAVVDSAGSLYIADTYNNRIRKVSTNGIISTVAGLGGGGYSGDGGAATNANLWYPFERGLGWRWQFVYR